MAKTLLDLTEILSLNDTDLIHIRDSTGDRKITVGNFKSEILSTVEIISLYQGGNQKVIADAVGVSILGNTTNDPTTPATQDTLISLENRSGVPVGGLGFGITDGFTLSLINYVHGGTVLIGAEDDSGDVQTLFFGDPEGSSGVFYAGVNKLSTLDDGIRVLGSSSANPGTSGIQDTKITLTNVSGAICGALGYNDDTTLDIGNDVLDGDLNLSTNGSGIVTINGVEAATYTQTSGIELGGDFDAGVTVDCARVGNVVTISISSVTLSHADQSVVTSGAVIPTAYRPTSRGRRCVANPEATHVPEIVINTTGTLSIRYWDWTGSLVAHDSAPEFTISYVI